ncbi:MAG: IclR family transcriptional regulator [Bacillota bacterium]
MSENEGRRFAVQSVERALLILEVLGANPAGLGVTAIGKELGLPKSTVHRLLAALASRGFVKQDEVSECYRLGMGYISLGLTYLHNLDLRREVLPYISELVDITGEIVQLAILERDEVLFIERRQPQETITVNPGLRAPAHCVAEGKVLLAYLPEAELRKYLRTQRIKPHALDTVISSEEMIFHLERVKAQGYAVSAGEFADNLRGVASPIFNVSGRVVAALGIIGPAGRLPLERINRLVNVLQETCYSVSLLLGCRKGDMGPHT